MRAKASPRRQRLENLFAGILSRFEHLGHETADVLVAVVGADPGPSIEGQRRLLAGRDAGADVSAEPPGVSYRVKAVEQGGKRQGRFRDEMVLDVGFKITVGDAVRGEDDGESGTADRMRACSSAEVG